MKPVRILFVCLGNICRSPLAEGILRYQAQDRPIEVDSAGTGSWHIGDPPDRRSIAVARRHGIDIAGQRGRKVHANDFEDFDLILAMDSSNLANLKALAPAGSAGKAHLFLDFTLGQDRDIPDPYYEGPEGFETVYHLLSEGCSSLIGRLERLS
ncbi:MULTISPECIES: low molecular weight protein-tyrosine-phosphatase [unclassified Rhizobium]|uniref:low molecular weight protein-tyrosine-phosphatase n=1 Tax=unclassified Rhizobium TaxID=2613769 RepID=UPI000714220C|nr:MULTISPECIES: low molecular weight protein-tyrosine-phosphatase [unclassified Rhizobium]KQS87691.1 protein tyrosine phosphatase [Rhizobium sp. Leaf391]KQT07127.1 protein tyrosine phosphatase [Rhizobium sp. Leaf386]KQT95253.1 protein tyrosine phosphatase [Rhizobium sp. Leaf453]